jgi:DNA-binding NarL/FixJ family response regulator
MPRREANHIRLLLVDDHKVVRIGLRTLLGDTDRIQVVGEAETMAAAVAEAARLKPNVILMDVRLPDGSGIEACREIRAARPETRVLFLTSYTDDDAVLATMFAGADGYLLKEIDEEGLIRAIESVAAGQSILDPAVKQRILTRMQSFSGPAVPQKGEKLSSQEQKVLALVAEGQTNKEIAAALGLSDKTVRNYLSNIFQKLQVTRRSQAAAIYARRSPK